MFVGRSEDGRYNVNDPVRTSCTYSLGTTSCSICGGDGKVNKPINCKHGRSSTHTYCSHGNTSQHD